MQPSQLADALAAVHTRAGPPNRCVQVGTLSWRPPWASWHLPRLLPGRPASRTGSSRARRWFGCGAKQQDQQGLVQHMLLALVHSGRVHRRSSHSSRRQLQEQQGRLQSCWMAAGGRRTMAEVGAGVVQRGLAEACVAKWLRSRRHLATT